jgi:hypothetical protein
MKTTLSVNGKTVGVEVDDPSIAGEMGDHAGGHEGGRRR